MPSVRKRENVAIIYKFKSREMQDQLMVKKFDLNKKATTGSDLGLSAHGNGKLNILINESLTKSFIGKVFIGLSRALIVPRHFGALLRR